MAKATICYLAQSEGNTSKCPNCYGKHLLKLTSDLDTWPAPFYPAPCEFQGRGLWTFSILKADGSHVPGHKITGEHLLDVVGEGKSAYYPIPVPDGFSELCIFYDKEGGPRINVAASISGVIVRPKESGKVVTGDDPNCPIASVQLPGTNFLPKNFVWSDDQMTKWNVPVELNGAWTASPNVKKGEKGKMVLEAKRYLPTDKFFSYCRFLNWELNLLTPTLDPPRIEESETIEFNWNSFAGLIAHYEIVTFDPDIREPTLKPGEISIGDPGPRQFLTVGEHRVAYEVSRLAEGSVRPIRNDMRSADHGSVLKEPRISRDLQDRIRRAARAASESQDELRELLRQLPLGRK